MQLRFRTNLSGDLAKMLMMGEVNNLADLGHLRQQAEGFLGSLVVERFHDVVGDERHP